MNFRWENFNLLRMVHAINFLIVEIKPLECKKKSCYFLTKTTEGFAFLWFILVFAPVRIHIYMYDYFADILRNAELSRNYYFVLAIRFK